MEEMQDPANRAVRNPELPHARIHPAHYKILRIIEALIYRMTRKTPRTTPPPTGFQAYFLDNGKSANAELSLRLWKDDLHDNFPKPWDEVTRGLLGEG